MPPKRRAPRAPLTPAQHELLSGVERLVYWLAYRAPLFLRRSIGLDAVRQECWLAACKAAHDWNPDYEYGAASFSSFVYWGVEKHLTGLKNRTAAKYRVWRTMPEGRGRRDDAAADAPVPMGAELPDHRGPSVHPSLALWCSDEARQLRSGLHWRYRLFLYLRCVEGVTLDEMAATFGISRARVQQVQVRAMELIEYARRRRTVRRQVAGRSP